MKRTIKEFIEELAQPFPRRQIDKYEHERDCKWLAHQLYVRVIRGPRSGISIEVFPDGAMMKFSEKPLDANIVITNRSF